MCYVVEELSSISGRSKESKSVLWPISYPAGTAAHSPYFELPECEADKSLLSWTDENRFNLDSVGTFPYLW